MTLFQDKFVSSQIITEDDRTGLGISAWFKNLGIRVTLLEESKSFKSLFVMGLRFWGSTQSVTLV